MSVMSDRSIQSELTVPPTARDHAIGSSDSALTVVEYGDFECPNCKQAAPAVKLLLGRFGDRMRFVYRHFPLQEVHRHAVAAAEAAESAGGQGKFWPMHDLLFDNQSRLESSELRAYAERLQLDLGRYAAEMDRHLHLGRVQQDVASGRASGVRATPTFFVDGKLQDVSYGLQSLFDVVSAALNE
jgi:protein-disulfide isomerase